MSEAASATVSPAPVPADRGDGIAGAVAMLVGCAVLIAAAPLLVRFADVGPVASAFWRMALAVPVLAGFVAYRARARGAATGSLVGALRPPAGRRGQVLVALAGLFFALDLAFAHAAYLLTSIANSMFLINTAPVIVVALGWSLLGERPDRRLIGALPLAIGGAFLLAAFRDAAALSATSLTGDLFSLAAAGFYAAYLVAVRKARAKISAVTVMLWSSAAAAIVLGAIALAKGETLMPQSVQGWAVVAALGIVCHALGQGMAASALGRVAVGPSSVVLLQQPVLATAFAWPLFGEMPGLIQGLGAALIVAAVLLARPR